MRADSITKSKVAAFASHLKHTGKLSEPTVNRYLSTLGHVFSVASSNDKRWVSKESVPEITHFKESRGRTEILSKEQQLRLFEAAWEDADPQLYLFTLMGFHSTGRHGEMVAHQWRNFFPDRNRMYIPDAKAGPRGQPLTVELTTALNAERAKQRQQGLGSDDDYVFLPGPGSKKPHRASFGSAFKRAVIRAGLDPKLITPHVMRHTSITALITSRVPLPLAQTISGHKTLAMLLHYYHAANPDIDDAVAILGA